MEQLYLWEQVCVIMKWIDLLLYPWVTCKKTKIRKNKIILFYSFLIFTFTFSLSVVQKSFMYFWLLPKSLCIFYFYLWSFFLWSKSTYVFLSFTCASFLVVQKYLCIFDFYLWSFSCGPKVLMYFLLLPLVLFPVIQKSLCIFDFCF